MVAALGFRIDDVSEARLYLVGSYNHIDWDHREETQLGDDFCVFLYKDNKSGQHSMTVEEGLDGRYVLRLIETKRYILKIKSKRQDVILPHFQNENNKLLKIDKDSDSVSFQFINYLGRSKMIFPENGKKLYFEIVPDKMDYETDYISLTEALAEECAGLLLEYSGSTSNLYKLSDEDQKSLLEQFIFLRQFCYDQNIQGLFAAIKRNPDRILVREDQFEPLGHGRPANKFYTDPFSYAKGWGKVDTGSGKTFYIPQQVAVTRKHDSMDTPANRFVKYAVEKFDFICTALLNLLDSAEGEKQYECYHEAKAMHLMLDEIIRDSFFDDVNALDIMPQNNQVLQKREGYSQIFSAYSMIDLALQLDWKGKDEVYEGESKNVALLYEYWLFFELYKIIRSIEGCTSVVIKEDPFLLNDNGLTVSLEQGKKSCQAFEIKKNHLKINLYYNRSFTPMSFKTTVYEGSYSRPFRPDYTLAIFPDIYTKGRYNGEDEAVREGAVSYIHFDAKYRITDLTAFIGKNEDLDEEEELLDDKIGSVVNTYKRGDLLKMHTYNDAIRRTVGSYVLYPGAGSQGTGVKFRLYDEILPGIGAFAIRPSIDLAGENELKGFIESLLQTKRTESSRLNRMRYYTEMVLKEPSVTKNLFEISDVKRDVANKGNPCIIGYIRADSEKDYYFSLKQGNLLDAGKEFLFYFYAIKGTNVYSHHMDIFKTTLFRFYVNHPQQTGAYKLEAVLCNVISNELLSKKELVSKLKIQGYNTSEEMHSADFYYVLKLKVSDVECKPDEIKLMEVNAQNGNDTFSPHSPKIICI